MKNINKVCNNIKVFIIAKVRKWIGCEDEINRVNSKYTTLYNAMHQLSKDRPDVLFWIDRDIKNEDIETSAPMVLISGNNINIDNVHLSFTCPPNAEHQIIVVNIENTIIQNSKFINHDYNDLYVKYNELLNKGN